MCCFFLTATNESRRVTCQTWFRSQSHHRFALTSSHSILHYSPPPSPALRPSRHPLIHPLIQPSLLPSSSAKRHTTSSDPILCLTSLPHVNSGPEAGNSLNQAYPTNTTLFKMQMLTKVHCHLLHLLHFLPTPAHNQSQPFSSLTRTCYFSLKMII